MYNYVYKLKIIRVQSGYRKVLCGPIFFLFFNAND